MNKGKFFNRFLSALAVISAIVCAAQPKAGEAATLSQAQSPKATPSWDGRFGPPGIQDGDLTTSARVLSLVKVVIGSPSRKAWKLPIKCKLSFGMRGD
jgi:hypothetical protein